MLLVAIAALALMTVGTARGGDDVTVGAGFLCIEIVATFNPVVSGGCVTIEYQHSDAAHVAGTAIIDDHYAAPGTIVDAFANGTVCGSTTLLGTGRFDFYVLGSEEREGCAATGSVIEFHVGGRVASETITFPDAPNYWPIFLSLSVMPEHAWYWFERTSVPPPEEGLAVEAFVGGTLCGETALGDEDDIGGFFIPPNIRGFSRLIVPSANIQAGCGVNGSLTEFRVGGLRAETALLWRPGVQRLNLQVQGDANCDFLVDPRDATLALQKHAGLVASVPCHGDADRDGDIDAFDARHILEFAAGITNALPL